MLYSYTRSNICSELRWLRSRFFLVPLLVIGIFLNIGSCLPTVHGLETEIGSDFTDNTGKVFEGEYIAYGVSLQKDERFTVHFEVKDGKELDMYIISSLNYISYKGNATQISGATSYMKTRLADHTQPYATKDEKYYIVVDNKDNGINDSKPVDVANYTLIIKFFEKNITQSGDNRTPFIALAFIVLIVGLTITALRAKLFGKKGEDISLEEELQLKKKEFSSKQVAHEKLSYDKVKNVSKKGNLEKGKNSDVNTDVNNIEKKSEKKEISSETEVQKQKSKEMRSEEFPAPKPLVVEEIDRIEAQQDLQFIGMNKRLVKKDERTEGMQVTKQKERTEERKELSKGEVDKKAEEIRNKLKKETKEVSKGPIVCEKCGARIYAKRLTCPECNSKLRR